MSDSPSITPTMEQFYAAKKQFPDTILFFRIGDFFEMFDDDAILASKILGIALTRRNKNSKNATQMCGVPHHSHQQYMMKLIKAGYKVAICEQLEDPAVAKGLMKRGVTRVVSPGTVMDEGEIPDASNNFLVAVCRTEDSFYIAASDISTGEVFLAKSTEQTLEDIINSFQPKEILCYSPMKLSMQVSQTVRTVPSDSKAIKDIFALYNVNNIKNLGMEDIKLAVVLDMIIEYVRDSLLEVTFARPKILSETDRLMLDRTAIKTLELLESGAENGRTLFSVLNYTRTAMGLRLLKWRLLNPSCNVDLINHQLSIVEYFVDNWAFTEELEIMFGGLYDIERITNRVASKRVSPRELVWLRDSLVELPRIADMLESTGITAVTAFGESMHECGRISEMLGKAIADEPPQTLKEGGLIKIGYHQLVDELRDIKDNGRQKIAALEADLKRSTGINQLKISYNKVFGYYIEVSKSNAAKMPPEFERRQTLVNAERFVTPEIKEFEDKIYNAEERLSGLEYELFCSVRNLVAESAEMLRKTASNIAELDLYLSFARAATMRGYVKPTVDNGDEIEVLDARHPVVEAYDRNPCVSNDIRLDPKDNRMLIITGPNMSGKSTYMRSVALVMLMAHAGSFVPASAARIGVVDRIFTRVGASDNISRGESTFMVEMVETANILRHATSKSLIILDEIGRGTSTFDGISIAWAVAEYILRVVKAKTLFATHYHELTEIAESSNESGVKNYTISVKESGGEIIFMRKLVPGVADKSYGIYVAQLAGLPENVVKRAERVLSDLQAPSGKADHARHVKQGEVVVRPMLIFDEDHPVIERLKNLEINTLTPMDALNIVAELKLMTEDENNI